MFYKVYWIEELLTTTWKVIFMKSERAKFHTSESCLSPLLLMTRSEEIRQETKNKYQWWLTAGKVVMMNDLKRSKHQP